MMMLAGQKQEKEWQKEMRERATIEHLCL